MIIQKMILVLSSILLIPSSSLSEPKEEPFDFNKELCSVLGYKYESEGDSEMLDNGKVIAKKTYDVKTRHQSVTITKKNSKNMKYASGTEDSEIYSDVQYADDDHISCIETDNQKIEFNYDSDMNLTDVFLNDSLLLHQEQTEGRYTVEYANGDHTESIRSGNTMTYQDSVSSVQYTLDSSTQSPVKSVSADENALYEYDGDGEVISKKNAFGYVKKEEDAISFNLFGTKGSVGYDGESVFVIGQGAEDELSVLHEESSESHLLNGNLLYKYDDSGMDDGIRTYSSPFGNVTYVYGKDGRLLERHMDGKDEIFEYDGLGRLVSEQCGSLYRYYGYDLMGNLHTVSGEEAHELAYLNNKDLNQLSSFDGNELRYDDFGNLVSYDEKEFRWSGARMIGYLGGDVEVSYAYSPEGTRLYKNSSTDGMTSYFYFDGRMMGACSEKDGTIHYFYDETGNPIGLTYNGTPFFYVHDPLGNITGILDSNAVPVVSYSYSTWGVPSIEYCSVNGLAKANQLVYKDYVYDWETGLYYLCSRYYSPSLMRFLSRDDLARISESNLKDPCYNLYSYAMDDPISMADIDGHMALAAAASASVMTMLAGISIIIATFCFFITIYNWFLHKAPRNSVSLPTLEDSKWDYYDLMKRAKEILKEGMFEFTVLAVCFWKKRVGHKDEKHHIIARAALRAQPARSIWVNDCHNEIDAEENTIYLKYMFHKHMHTYSYFDAVNVLIKKGWKDGLVTGVETNLAYIKTALESMNKHLSI